LCVETVCHCVTKKRHTNYWTVRSHKSSLLSRSLTRSCHDTRKGGSRPLTATDSLECVCQDIGKEKGKRNSLSRPLRNGSKDSTGKGRQSEHTLRKRQARRREELSRFPDDCSMKLAEFLFHVFRNPERIYSNPVGWGADHVGSGYFNWRYRTQYRPVA